MALEEATQKRSRALEVTIAGSEGALIRRRCWRPVRKLARSIVAGYDGWLRTPHCDGPALLWEPRFPDGPCRLEFPRRRS